MSDRQLMRAVRAACEELVAELDALGWEFDNAEPLHPPGVVGLEHLEALQTWIGPVPDVAVDFWLEVGGIDLSGEHPDWDEDGLVPLVIEAPVDDLLEAVAREKEEEGKVKRLPVSPDFAWTLPDVYVVGAGEALPLIDHLRIALLEQGGIRGFTGERPEELDAVAAALPRF